jgi:hypothetical protein
MMEKLTGESNCIRLVYGVGELPVCNVKETTHQIGSFPLMIKVGRSLDHGTEPGIFKV